MTPVIFECPAKAELVQGGGPLLHRLGTDSANQTDQWSMKVKQGRSFSNLLEDILLERNQFGKKSQDLLGGRVAIRKESRSGYPAGTQRLEVSRYHLE